MERILRIDISENNAFFLWGARKAGKTTYLKNNFKDALYIDLLKTNVAQKYELNPALLREEIVANKPALVIVDEIQKIPQLLDEIHWCIENTPSKFILCGSSARKLIRMKANLLGGRAWRYEMFPLTTAEIGADFDLLRAINHGLIPQHYFSNYPARFLESYVLDYLSHEIKAEAMVRNVPAFHRFLEVAAISNSEIINFSSIARDCGVSSVTVKDYFQILQDTLLGFILNPYTKKIKRTPIESSKFYFFDMGITRALRRMLTIQEGSVEFGHFFEHFILMEIRAFLSYCNCYKNIYFWRTNCGKEVDLVIGEAEWAIEIKTSKQKSMRDFKGLLAFGEEFPNAKLLAITFDDTKRIIDQKIEVFPWQDFLKQMWDNSLI
ncbi:MAG: AAA family ATPase [Bacteroidales bacterium]|nr:AAA family ATPase [Bacteroidales bacterium]